MAYCPICKKEYGLSVTICPECNVSLQEDTTDVKVPMFSLQKEEDAKGFVEFAAENGISCAYDFVQRENAYKIYVSKKDQKKAPKLFAQFCMLQTRKKKGEDAVPKAEDIKRAQKEAEEKARKEQEEKERLAREKEEQIKAEKAREAKERLEREKARVKAEREKEEAEKAARKAAQEAILKEKERQKAEKAAAESRAVKEAKAKAEAEKAAAEAKAANEKAEAEAKKAAEEAKKAEEAIKAAEKASFSSVSQSFNPDLSFAKNEEPKKDSKPSSDSLIQLFEQKQAYRNTNQKQQAFGSFNKQKEESSKNSDLLNLFLNPAQSAPKRDTYKNLDEAIRVDTSDSRFSVAPGEDPVFDRPSDPFYGERVKSSSATESFVSPEPSAPVEIKLDDFSDDVLTPPDMDFTYTSEPDFEPDEGDSYHEDPIFVETKPVDDEELDNPNIVDAASVITLEKEEAEEEVPEEKDDAFSAFLSNFKKENVITPEAEVSSDVNEDSQDDILDNFLNEIHEIEKNIEGNPDHSVIAEVLPDREKYSDSDDYSISSTSGRPKDIQDTKIKVSADSNIIEEVFDDNVEVGKAAKDVAFSVADSSVAADTLTQSARKFLKDTDIAEYSDIEDYKGFIPDYSFEEKKEDIDETPEQAAYRQFTEKVAERKREMELAESQQRSQQTRKNSLEHDLGKKKGKIVFEDTEELDSYAGFIPDYKPNTDSEKDFEFYKPHTVSSYAKYKKGKKDTSDSSLINMTHMRTTSADEIRNVFIEKIPSNVKNTIDPSFVRSTGFLISMSGKQLAQLFNSWLMLNMTASYVKQFEKNDQTHEENAESKIEGIKGVIRNTFGEINESFLDYVVRKYYDKYLED